MASRRLKEKGAWENSLAADECKLEKLSCFSATALMLPLATFKSHLGLCGLKRWKYDGNIISDMSKSSITIAIHKAVQVTLK